MKSRSFAACTSRLPVVVVLLAGSAFFTRPAAAWDQATHASILGSAIAISPMADAWAAAADPFKIMEAARIADPLDVDCQYHFEGGRPRDPAARAEQIFKQLQAPKMALTPYSRAIAIGQLAHYVADCAVPRVLYAQPSMTPTGFFSATNFVVFREKLPVVLPLAKSLRDVGALALWGEDTPAGRSAAYRLAVNLVVEVISLLPPPTAAKPGNVDVVVFGVDRLDNGTRSNYRGSSSYGRGYGGYGYGSGYGSYGADSSYSSSSGYSSANNGYYGYGNGSGYGASSGYSSGYYGSGYYDHYGSGFYGSSGRGSTGWADTSTKTDPLPDRKGLQVVEWNTRAGDKVTHVKLLVFNNEATCAKDLVLSAADSWTYNVPGRVAPYALRVVELDVPPFVKATNLNGEWKAGECGGPFEPAAGVQSINRLVAPASGFAPRLEESIPQLAGGGPPKT